MYTKTNLPTKEKQMTINTLEFEFEAEELAVTFLVSAEIDEQPSSADPQDAEPELVNLEAQVVGGDGRWLRKAELNLIWMDEDDKDRGITIYERMSDHAWAVRENGPTGRAGSFTITPQMSAILEKAVKAIEEKYAK